MWPKTLFFFYNFKGHLKYSTCILYSSQVMGSTMDLLSEPFLFPRLLSGQNGQKMSAKMGQKHSSKRSI